MTVQQRPTGITILAILALIGGGLTLLAGVTYIAFGSVAGGRSGGLGELVVVLGIVLLVTAAIELAFAYGAWRLRPWAWALGIAGAALGIVSNVLQIVDGQGSLAAPIASIVVFGAIIYYLNTPAVKGAFSRG